MIIQLSMLDSGAMETIVPSVEGSTMVLSTHSFSPFGIAGSKALVGEEIEDGSYSSRYNFYRDNDSAGDSSSFHKYRQYIWRYANNASNMSIRFSE